MHSVTNSDVMRIKEKGVSELLASTVCEFEMFLQCEIFSRSGFGHFTKN